MTRTRYNWLLIGEEYVESEKPITQAELAKKHGVGRSTLAEYCRRENWLQQREDYWNDTKNEMRQRGIDRQAEAGLDTLKVMDDSIRALASMIEDLTGEWEKRKEDGGIKELTVNEIGNRLATATNALDKAMRARELLTGGGSGQGRQVTLADILGAAHE